MRATGFSKDRVNEFFQNYLLVLQKYKFQADRIYNLDKTGISTVLKSVNVVSTKEKNRSGRYLLARGAKILRLLA